MSWFVVLGCSTGTGRAVAEAAEVDARLNDPALYAERAWAVPDLVARQEALRTEIERLMARWVELEAKKSASA